MAPRFSAPRVWKRPYTSIYSNNYKYGNSLYSDAISDIERKYNESMARTKFRSDRPDINFHSFSDSQLVGESIISRQRAAASAAAAAVNVDNELQRSISSSRVNYRRDNSLSRGLEHSESFSAYQSSRALSSVQSELDESKLRRSRSTNRRRRPESAYASVSAYEDALLSKDDSPGQAFWTERCRELMAEVESIKEQLVESEDKLRHESNAVKNKITQDVSDLLLAIDDQDKQIAELQKLLKKQAKQVADVTLELEASQRHYTDIQEVLTQTQKRAQNLVHEVDEMRSSLDKQNRKSSLTSTRRSEWISNK